jgi:hypothetical protein
MKAVKRELEEVKKIAIDDEEMELLGKRICQQTFLYDGQKYKLHRTDIVEKVGYYVKIK